MRNIYKVFCHLFGGGIKKWMIQKVLKNALTAVQQSS